MRVVNKNTWIVENVSLAEFILAEDDFEPKLDVYLLWMVEWVYELHFGESV